MQTKTQKAKERSYFRTFSLILALCIPMIAAGGCDTTQSRTDQPGQLRVVMQIDTNPVSIEPFNAAVSDDILILEEVKMFVEEFELEGENFELEIENFVVDLPLNETPFVLFDQQIPGAKLEELELEIDKPDDDVNLQDPDFRNENGSYSIIVKGTFNGNPFVFRSQKEFEFEFEWEPPISISEDEGATVVVAIDLSKWFLQEDGTNLDPRDESHASKINSNIKKSFRTVINWH